VHVLVVVQAFDAYVAELAKDPLDDPKAGETAGLATIGGASYLATVIVSVVAWRPLLLWHLVRGLCCVATLTQQTIS